MGRMSRREFGIRSGTVAAGFIGGGFLFGLHAPRVTFCGAAQRVSGSCHLLETSKGLFLVDCGLFFPGEGDDAETLNQTFPYFSPRDIKAVFLTHAHIDHNGRLPLLYEKGFRGPIYCTDCTRDLSAVMLNMTAGIAEGSDDAPRLYGRDAVDAILGQFQTVPYDTRIERHGLEFEFTEAGHILGSAMVEVRADGRSILFSGDMGNEFAPLLRRPAPHREADLVLVESTYGPSPRVSVDFMKFGEQVMRVIAGGGSVLLPAFVLHKSQALIFIINRLKGKGVIDPRVPVYSDSSTAKEITKVYHRYEAYYHDEAKTIGEPFYRSRYFEVGVAESLNTHGKEPAIYVASSGMLDHAAAPKHLLKMASDPKNAVIVVGWQSPKSLGRKLLGTKKGEKVQVPWEERDKVGIHRELREVAIHLTVSEWKPGFSSHASGQQILDWLQGFDRVGAVCVVHGEPANAAGLAQRAGEMGLNAAAVKMGEYLKVRSQRVRPGPVPELPAASSPGFAPTDQ
jgi:metallo-beta-lactamase family protein